MKPETQAKVENRAKKMYDLWTWIKRFGSAMLEAARRYHATPTKQSEPKAGKPKPLTERRAERRRKPDGLTSKREVL